MHPRIASTVGSPFAVCFFGSTMPISYVVIVVTGIVAWRPP